MTRAIDKVVSVATSNCLLITNEIQAQQRDNYDVVGMTSVTYGSTVWHYLLCSKRLEKEDVSNDNR